MPIINKMASISWWSQNTSSCTFSPDARTFHNMYKLQKHVLLRHQSYLIAFMGNKNLRFLTDNAPLRATKCSSIYCYTSSNLKQAIANHKPRWENNLQRYNSSCRWSIICLPTSFRFVSSFFVSFRCISFHFPFSV